jgi:hypothetical protein
MTVTDRFLKLDALADDPEMKPRLLLVKRRAEVVFQRADLTQQAPNSFVHNTPSPMTSDIAQRRASTTLLNHRLMTH